VRTFRSNRAFAILSAAAVLPFWTQEGSGQSQTPNGAARLLEYPYDSTPGGIYTIDNDYTFNILDAVYYQ